ncbi:MAG TPA: DUF1080 domain-containing protein [Granulicella sp.]
MRSILRSTSVLLAAAAFLAVVPAPLVAQQATPKPFNGTFNRAQPDPLNFDDHTGWTQIFNGKDLSEWDGPSDVWSYEDGAIVGKSSDEQPSGTTNILWKGGTPANFELRMEIKLDGLGANGGVQYRSSRTPITKRTLTPEQQASMTPEQKARFAKNQEMLEKHAQWNLKGYQYDIDGNNRYSGQLYEQNTGRGIIAYRGQVVKTEAGRKPTLLGTLGTTEELGKFYKPGEWNQIEIIADGNTVTHILNGHVMSIFVDTDPAYLATKGVIALEIEGSGTLKISHRNIYLKPLP